MPTGRTDCAMVSGRTAVSGACTRALRCGEEGVDAPRSSALRPSGAKGSLLYGGATGGGALGRSQRTVWKTTTRPLLSSNQTCPSASAIVWGCDSFHAITGLNGDSWNVTPSAETAQPICSWIFVGLGVVDVPSGDPEAIK